MLVMLDIEKESKNHKNYKPLRMFVGKMLNQSLQEGETRLILNEHLFIYVIVRN